MGIVTQPHNGLGQRSFAKHIGDLVRIIYDGGVVSIPDDCPEIIRITLEEFDFEN